MLNVTNITPPRVPLTDSRTGLISREWYLFFLNLFELTGSGGSSVSLEDLQVGPPQTSETVLDILRPHLDNVQPSDQSLVSQVAELQKQVQGLALGTLAWDGSVTSVDVSGGTTGLTFSGGPVTTSGTLTLAGTLAVGNGGTGETSWTANGMLYASASNTLTNGSAVTYDGTTFGVTGKGSYLDPSLSTGGFNIVASYSYNDNNTNSIGSDFNNAHNIIHVRTSAGITSIPIYTNGGAGVAWAYNYLDPDAGSWAYSTTSPTITFTQNGTGGNTFSIVLNSNTSVGTIQRTAGTQSYTVSIQRLVAV